MRTSAKRPGVRRLSRRRTTPSISGAWPASRPSKGNARSGLGPVHQHGLAGAVERLLARPRQAILRLLHQRRPLGHGRRRNRIGHGRRGRALLGGVGEDAQPVEGHVLDEGQEIVEGGLGLPGEAHQHRGPHGDARDGLAELGDDLLHPARRHRPAHRAQHAVVAVLHRHVEVRHHARARPAGDEAVVDVRGVEVHGPDPRHLRIGEREQQIGDVPVAGEIAAIGQRVLGDEDGLLDPARGEPLHLGDHVPDGAAAVAAAELRDRAERAAHVAALGDLHVGIGRARAEEARRGRVVEIARRRRGHPVLPAVGLVHEVHDAVQLGGAEDGVDFRDLGEDVLPVALGEAAGHDERAGAAPLLQLGQVEDGVDRLLAGAVDEGAGIDHQALGGLGARRRSRGRPWPACRASARNRPGSSGSQGW